MPGFDFLKRMWIFDGLDDSQLKKLEACCSIEKFKKGDRLFSDNENATHLFILSEGQVDLRYDVPGEHSSDLNTITSIRQCQAFGWSALTHSPIYTLSAYCVTDTCKVVQVERKSLLALFDQDFKMGYVLMANIAEVIRTRFHQFQEDMSRRKGLIKA